MKQNIVTEAIIGDSVAYIFRAFDVIKEQEGKADPDMEVADYQLHYGKVFKVSKTEVGVRFQDQEEWYFNYDEYRLGRELTTNISFTGERIQFSGKLYSNRNIVISSSFQFFNVQFLFYPLVFIFWFIFNI